MRYNYLEHSRLNHHLRVELKGHLQSSQQTITVKKRIACLLVNVYTL
jgi:hypothetical protein